MPRKIFILVGHPDKDSFSNSLGEEYSKGALKAGNEVREMYASKMKYDPILHKGYKKIQKLEPDLKKFQENVKWADHFVIIYPSWWSTMPALLKGLFDRAWLPGFAFRFYKDKPGWEGLLKGKDATVFVLSNSAPVLARVLFGDSTNEIKHGILKFSGFNRVRIKKIGGINEKLTIHDASKIKKKFLAYGKIAF